MTIESWFHRNIREKPTLKILTKLIFESFRLAFKSKRDLNLENFAFCQQLAKQQQKIKRPKLSGINRLFWVWLSNIWLDLALEIQFETRTIQDNNSYLLITNIGWHWWITNVCTYTKKSDDCM